MKRFQLSLGILAAFVVMLSAAGCGKKTDEALLTEYNAKKGEAEKVIADATEGLKKLNEEHSAWMAKISETSATKGIDSIKASLLMEKLHAHEPMVPVVQAGIDSLKYYVTAKTETDDEIKAATAGLNAHLAAVSANWKALWEAHTKAGADIMAELGVASTPMAGDTVGEKTTTTSSKTTTTTTTSSEKHETAKHTPGGTAKVPPANAPTTSTPTDQSKHETAKQTPGGTPKTPPAPGGTKK
jgi:hypothetical protein